MELEELIGMYWEHYRLAHGAREERLRAEDLFWAWEVIEGIVRDQTDIKFSYQQPAREAFGSYARGYRGQRFAHRPLDVIVKLADHAPDEEALGYLGAGPIEDYLEYGKPDLSGVEEATKHNSRFRTALRCAWFDKRLSADDATRLRNALREAERMQKFGPRP